jgi:hypothetical protein
MHVHAVLVPHPDPVVGHIVTNHQARRTIRTCDKKTSESFLILWIFIEKGTQKRNSYSGAYRMYAERDTIHCVKKAIQE